MNKLVAKLTLLNSSLIITGALLFFAIPFVISKFANPEPSYAQTCYWYDWTCTGGPFGCNIDTQGDYQTVSCTPQGPGSCPESAPNGERCDHSGYTHVQWGCDAPAQSGGNYTCRDESSQVGAGFCGCYAGDPPPPGDDGGGSGGGDECPETCGCINVNVGTPDEGCWCAGGTSPGWQYHGLCGEDVNTGACPEGCQEPPDCTPTSCSCVAPGPVTITSPAPGSPLTVNSVIDWQLGTVPDAADSNWGTDGGQQGCDGVSCTYSGSGKYQLFVNGTNQTSRCSGAVGSGADAYLPSSISQCTLISVDPSWTGNTVNVRINASNGGCGTDSATTTFSFPEDEKPYCDAFATTGGRIAKGNLGALPNDPLTITVTGGETDPFGPPANLQLCYAIRGQATSFYQQGPAAFECFEPMASNTTSYTVTTTIQEMINNYTPTAPYTGTPEENGFVINANVMNNVPTGQFCSTNIGWNNGNGVYWPSNTEVCDGGDCVLNIFDHRPQIEDVDPIGTTYVGTEADDDNGDMCLDNNPHNYEMLVSDADGSSDIDLIQFNLASDANTLIPDPTWAGMERWEMRAMFAKNWGGLASNTFFLRDKNVNTGGDCYRADRTLTPSSAASKYCFAPDNHTWSNGVLVQNVSLNNTTVNIYYLNTDLEVYSDGHITRLKGGSSWQEASYVAYEINGDRVWANFNLAFLDDGNKTWEGDYNKIWYVRDILEKDDITANIGEQLMRVGDVPWTFHNLGNVIVDFSAPIVTLEDPYPLTATDLNLSWSATDNGSGLEQVIGEATQTDPENAYPVMDETATGDDNVPGYDPGNQNSWYQLNGDSEVGEDYLWNVNNISGSTASRDERINIGDNEQGGLSFLGRAYDNSCNESDNPGGEITEDLFLPWTITRGGHVYTQGSPNVDVKNFDPDDYSDVVSPSFTTEPFENFLKGEVELSTEFLGAGTLLPADQIVNQPRTDVFGLGTYTESNNRQNYWYGSFSRELDAQIVKDPGKYRVVTKTGNISGNVSALSGGGESCASGSDFCIVEANGNINVTGALTCNRKTAFMISGNLTIDADITANNRTNGCIFIVQGNVIVNDGAYKSSGSSYPKYDYLQGFFIADGYVNVTEADLTRDIRDGLKVYGSMLGFGTNSDGKSILFERSLKLLDNYLYPVNVLHHDARYISIAKEIFGGESDTYKKEIGFKPL